MSRKALRRWIYTLILVLVLEGIVRKMVGGGLSSVLIFAKDLVALIITIGVLTKPLPSLLNRLRTAWMVFSIALIPLVILTALKDPVLAVFGTKQYLLFFSVAFAVPLAFYPKSTQPTELLKLARFIGYLIVPTTALALFQIAISPTHWLNLSVAGEDLTGFSAGGRLRVSSTFPFIAQYNFFLTFVAGWMVIAMRWRGTRWWRWALLPSVILPAFMVGLFSTGSRQSVVGALIILIVAGIVVVMLGRQVAFRRFISFGIAMGISLFAAQILFPDAFIAYDTRTRGDTFGVEHSAELGGRATHALFGWMHFAERTNAGLFGRGLGMMSNGVQNLSPYAAEMRSRYGWGEVDLANTVAEGGYYLVLVWAAFRIFVIMACFFTVLKIRSGPFAVGGALMFGYVLFNGLFGALGIQPPLYLWWSLAVGGIFLLQLSEQRILQLKKKEKEESQKAA